MTTRQLLRNRSSCTCRCRSLWHCSQILTAISRAENLLQSQFFLLLECRNFWNLYDQDHRSLVHWTAARGNTKLLEWLLDKFAPDIISKDLESHYTPLHLAFLHGQIATAQVLINHGASLFSLDNENSTPIELIHNDQTTQLSISDPTEVYTMGDNMSFNLGHQFSAPKTVPELVNYFRRLSISVKKLWHMSHEDSVISHLVQNLVIQVAMSKLHTVFLSTAGKVYVCGHGIGGRLGVGDEKSRVSPDILLIDQSILDVAVSTMHTVFVDDSGDVYTCGQNDHGCLSLGPFVKNQLTPALVPFKDVHHFVGCAAAIQHSAIWTANGAVFTCGRNNGQLGHQDVNIGAVVWTFKKIPKTGAICDNIVGNDDILVESLKNRFTTPQTHKSRRFLKNPKNRRNYCSGEAIYGHPTVKFSIYKNEITVEDDRKPIVVIVSELCTLIGSENGDIRLFTDFQWTIIGRKRLEMTQLAVCDKPLLVLMITTFGTVLIWDEKCRQLQKAAFVGFPLPKNSVIRNLVLYIGGGLLMTTENGQLYKGKVVDSKVISMSTRIPTVHRAVGLQVTMDGRNLAILQRHPSVDLQSLPPVDSGHLQSDMRKLLLEANADDGLSDLLIRTSDNHLIATHRFVLYSRSAEIRNEVKKHSLNGVWSLPFPMLVTRQFMLYLYTNWCDLLSLDTTNCQSYFGNPLTSLSVLAEKYSIKRLQMQLKTINWGGRANSTAKCKSPTPSELRFDKNKCADLKDIDIECSDGFVIRAHRCILCSRLAFFRSMFTTYWRESCVNSIPLPINKVVAGHFMHFIYTDQLDSTDFDLNSIDMPSNTLCGLLIIADQLLVGRLKHICEQKLAHLLSLRNAHELLQFAEMYNASQLKVICATFISLNLTTFIDEGHLALLDGKSLESIGDEYRRLYPNVGQRRLTPIVDGGPSLEELRILETECQSLDVNVDDLLAEFMKERTNESTLNLNSVRRKSPRKRRDSYEMSSLILDDIIATDLCESVLHFEINVRMENTHLTSSKKSDVGAIFAVDDIRKWNSTFPGDDSDLNSIVQSEIDDIKGDRKCSTPWGAIPSSSTNSNPPYVFLQDIINSELALINDARKCIETVTKKSWTTVVHPWEDSANRTGLVAIQNEQQTREKELLRLHNKPLKIIQLEEKAMQELLQMYIHEFGNDDQVFTVERVVVVSDPARTVWPVHGN